MLGIMLAAGDATRMPNKALLPQRHSGRLIVESGLHFLQRHCNEVVVVSQNDLLSVVLRSRGWSGLAYACQPEATGVCDAISCGCVNRNQRNVLVAFCDNVYHGDELPPGLNDPHLRHASVRRLDHAEHLDGWDESQWVKRGSYFAWALAGWLRLPYEVASRAREHDDLVGFLNFHAVTPVISTLEWHDVGTYDSYRRYLLCE